MHDPDPPRREPLTAAIPPGWWRFPAAVLLAAFGAAALATWMSGPAVAPRPTAEAPLLEARELPTPTSATGPADLVQGSPDGPLAWSDGATVWQQPDDGRAATAVPGPSARLAAVSPRGQRLFSDPDGLRLTSPEAPEGRVVGPAVAQAAFLDEAHVLVADAAGTVARLDLDGGARTVLASPGPLARLVASPDGRRAAWVRAAHGPDAPVLAVLDLAGGEPRVLLEDARLVQAEGRAALTFVDGDTLLVARTDGPGAATLVALDLHEARPVPAPVARFTHGAVAALLWRGHGLVLLTATPPRRIWSLEAPG